jgi:hypothetical protein
MTGPDHAFLPDGIFTLGIVWGNEKNLLKNRAINRQISFSPHRSHVLKKNSGNGVVWMIQK